MKGCGQINRIIQGICLCGAIAFNTAQAGISITADPYSAAISLAGAYLNSVEHESQKQLLKSQIQLVLTKINEVNNNVLELRQTTCALSQDAVLGNYGAFLVDLDTYLLQPVREQFVMAIHTITSGVTNVRVHLQDPYLTAGCFFSRDIFPLYVAVTNLELNLVAEEMRDTYREYYLRDQQTGLIRNESVVDQATLNVMNATIHDAIQLVLHDRLAAIRDYLVRLDDSGIPGTSGWHVYSDSTFKNVNIINLNCWAQRIGPRCGESAAYVLRGTAFSYGREFWWGSDVNPGPLIITAPLGSTELDFQNQYDYAAASTPSPAPMSGWPQVGTVYNKHQFETYIKFIGAVHRPFVAAVKSWLTLQDSAWLARPDIVAKGITEVKYPTLVVDFDLDLDQKLAPASALNPQGPRLGAALNQALQQTFTASRSGSLTSASVYGHLQNTPAPGDLIVQVKNASGTILASGSVGVRVS